MPGPSNVDNFLYGPVKIVHQKPSDEYYLTNLLNIIFSNLFLICNFPKLSLIVYANKGICRVASDLDVSNFEHHIEG